MPRFAYPLLLAAALGSITLAVAADRTLTGTSTNIRSTLAAPTL